jgi:hypothetical protein
MCCRLIYIWTIVRHHEIGKQMIVLAIAFVGIVLAVLAVLVGVVRMIGAGK